MIVLDAKTRRRPSRRFGAVLLRRQCAARRARLGHSAVHDELSRLRSKANQMSSAIRARRHPRPLTTSGGAKWTAHVRRFDKGATCWPAASVATDDDRLYYGTGPTRQEDSPKQGGVVRPVVRSSGGSDETLESHRTPRPQAAGPSTFAPRSTSWRTSKSVSDRERHDRLRGHQHAFEERVARTRAGANGGSTAADIPTFARRHRLSKKK